jgi:hypothetical protein
MGHSGHLLAPSLPPRAPVYPGLHRHRFNSEFPPLLRPLTGAPLRRPPSPSQAKIWWAPSPSDPPPNRLPLGSGKDVGPTFPGSPPSAGQKRPASRRLRLPLFSPWAQRGKWAKPISRARPSSSVG